MTVKYRIVTNGRRWIVQSRSWFGWRDCSGSHDTQYGARWCMQAQIKSDLDSKGPFKPIKVDE